MAEIGVVLLMFGAGLETNLKDLLKTGPKAALIALFGVFFPLICGTLLYGCFYGFGEIGTDSFYRGIFIGIVTRRDILKYYYKKEKNADE